MTNTLITYYNLINKKVKEQNMKRAKEFRRQAWNSIRGKWGTLVITYLVYLVIFGCVGALSVIPSLGAVLGSIVTLIITGPFSLGLSIISLNIVRGDNVTVNNLFVGFKRFLDAFLANLINGILIALWSLLFIIPGIIKGYSYSMTYYILADNPSMTANDARKKSMVIMRGNKWRLFCLQLSFIGWLLLCVLTLGILTLWISPYIQTATAAFYEDISAPLKANYDNMVENENIAEDT